MRQALQVTSSGLPGHFYTDPAAFAREMQTIWSTTWQLVGRVEEVPNPGDYIACRIGNEPIIVIRGTDNILRALHNVCAHRGAQIVDKSGTCKGQLRCPYHAWGYALDGALLSISQNKLFPEIDRSKLGLLPARVDTWGGFLFVCADFEGPTLADFLADFPHFLEQYKHPWPELREVKRWSYDLAVNWKFLVENYVEDYHFPYVHKQSLGGLFEAYGVRTRTTGDHTEVAVPFTKTRPEGKDADEWEEGGTSYQGFIFPNLMVNTHNNHVAFFVLVPLEAARTRWDVIVYQTPQQQLEYPFKEHAYDEVLEEDFALCRALQAGANSRAYRVSHLAAEHELGVEHFYATVAKYLSR